MPQTGTPWVRQGQLLTRGNAPIGLDTPAWFGWLETATRFCYSARHTFFRLTARKEKRRGIFYWYGYLKNEGKLHNIYLGKSERLTQAYLDAALSRLARKAQEGGKKAMGT
jgi:LuxR family maltose regulon positive regulatory protein